LQSIETMARITIRNLDDSLKRRLRVRAAHHGRSMEDEAREILGEALLTESGPPSDLATAIRERFAQFGGVDLDLEVDLDLAAREPMRDPPSFER